jgi:carboxypeptidase PM20D1
MNELISGLSELPWAAILGMAAGVLCFFAVILLFGALRFPPLKGKRGAPQSVPAPMIDHAADSLCALISCHTVGPDETGARKTSEFQRLRDVLKRAYPRVHQTMEREVIAGYSLLYRWPCAGTDGDPPGNQRDDRHRPLLFCAHIDVVLPGEGWSKDPFNGIREGGRVYGRGALDCKSQVTALFEAAENLIAEGFTPARDIYFAFSHDEESGGEGAAAMARLLASRGLRFMAVLDEGGRIERGVLGAAGAAAFVPAAEKGLLRLKLSAADRPASPASPPRHTVLGRLSEAVSRIEYRRRPAKLTPLLRDGLRALAPVLPFSLRLRIAFPRLFARSLCRALDASDETAALTRTTAAVTSFTIRSGAVSGEPDSLPVSGEITVKIYPSARENCRRMARFYADLLSGLSVDIDILSAAEPSAVSHYKGSFFALLSENIQAVFGEVPVVPWLQTTTGDARRYEILSSSVFRFSPFEYTDTERSGLHGPDESVDERALGSAIAFYQRLMTAISGGALPPTEARPSEEFAEGR